MAARTIRACFPRALRTSRADAAWYLSDADYWARRIQVKAPPGSTIVDRDNFGTDNVTKGRSGTPLPDTDQYWCSGVDSGGDEPSRTYALGQGVTVVGNNPAAIIESFSLTRPGTNELGTTSLGFTMKLLVKHTGVLELSIPAVCLPGSGGLDGGAPDADASVKHCSTPSTYGLFTIVQ